MKTIFKAVHIIFILFKSLKSEMEPLVIQGVPVKITSFPQSVLLSAKCVGTVWICGSSILNQKLLLTAAHCVYLCNKSKYEIAAYAGHETTSKSTIVRKVQTIIWHNQFDQVTLDNDIALLALRRDLPFSRTTKRTMITRTFPSVLEGYLAGWGLINDVTGQLAADLQAVAQPIRSAQDCRLLGELHDGMFCAGSRRKDFPRPAFGDSGSAFVVGNRVYHQIGVLSWTTMEYPALQIYTNVSYYYSWIRENSAIIFCQS